MTGSMPQLPGGALTHSLTHFQDLWRGQERLQRPVRPQREGGQVEGRLRRPGQQQRHAHRQEEQRRPHPSGRTQGLQEVEVVDWGAICMYIKSAYQHTSIYTRMISDYHPKHESLQLPNMQTGAAVVLHDVECRGATITAFVHNYASPEMKNTSPAAPAPAPAPPAPPSLALSAVSFRTASSMDCTCACAAGIHQHTIAS